MDEESWRRNHGGGIMEKGSWKRNHGGGGIIEEESWRRNHVGVIGEEASSQSHLGSIWEASGRSSGRPGRRQEAQRRLGGKSCQNMCFTIKSEATDHFACTRRERPSPNTVKTDRLAPAWSTRGARRHFTRLLKSRQNPYS